MHERRLGRQAERRTDLQGWAGGTGALVPTIKAEDAPARRATTMERRRRPAVLVLLLLLLRRILIDCC